MSKKKVITSLFSLFLLLLLFKISFLLLLKFIVRQIEKIHDVEINEEIESKTIKNWIYFPPILCFLYTFFFFRCIFIQQPQNQETLDFNQRFQYIYLFLSISKRNRNRNKTPLLLLYKNSILKSRTKKKRVAVKRRQQDFINLRSRIFNNNNNEREELFK